MGLLDNGNALLVCYGFEKRMARFQPTDAVFGKHARKPAAQLARLEKTSSVPFIIFLFLWPGRAAPWRQRASARRAAT